MPEIELKLLKKLNYNFVETPRKFIIAELLIRKLGSSAVLIKITMQIYKELKRKLNDFMILLLSSPFKLVVIIASKS